MLEVSIITFPSVHPSLFQLNLSTKFGYLHLANIIKFFTSYVCLCAKSLQLCPTLCDPMNCSLPGSSVHGILQERILEWVAMSSSRGSSQTRDQTCVSSTAGRLFTIEPLGKPSNQITYTLIFILFTN